MERKTRVRFAPSPTGPLHIGGVRTALYNYLFARHFGGDIILRIEDTDSRRYVPGAEQYIIEALDWLGIRFDEGVGIGGPHGPYRQSERSDIYRRYADELLAKGRAYIAFDTPEELDAARAAQPNFQYDASTRMNMTNSLTLTPEQVRERIDRGDRYVVRFKVEPGQEVVVDDLVRGRVTINSSVIDDKVLFKTSDNLPTYHLANIVDDHLMEITHVIRGEEWLPSAPLHVLLYRAFGWEDTMPRFAHLPLLLKPVGNGKLSKRDGDKFGFPVFPLRWVDPATGDVSMGYREKGYLPHAVINFLALLGWNPGDDSEMMTLGELIDKFSIDHCSKAGARFDYKKGLWFNHEYMLVTPDAELARLFMPLLREKGVEASPEYVEKVVGLVKSRATLIPDLWTEADFFFVAPTEYAAKDVRKRWRPGTPAILSELLGVLAGIEDMSSANAERIVLEWIESKGYHLGNVMNAFRLAVVGSCRGPHMFDITEIMPRAEIEARVRRAIAEIPEPEA